MSRRRNGTNTMGSDDDDNDHDDGLDTHGNPLLDEELGGLGTMTASTAQAVEDANAIPEMSVEEAKKVNRSQIIWTTIVTVTAVSAMGFAGATMALQANVISAVAFWVPMVTAPYVIYQRGILNKLPALIHVINEARNQVNRLTQLNRLFSKENDRLTLEVADLKQMEYRLKYLCQQNGTNVEEFQSLIRENGEIQKQMRKILDAQQLQEIFSIFLKSDSDRDFILSERELDRMMLRLRGYNIVDQERLKDKIRRWFYKATDAEWKKLGF